MPIHHESFECERCGGLYSTSALAVACEKQVDPIRVAKPGEVVVVRAGSGAHPDWVSNPDVRAQKGHGNCFKPCCRQFPYHVVGVVEVERESERRKDIRNKIFSHRIKYHLHTLGDSGETMSGYTFDVGHHEPRRVEPQPKLAGMATFIGKRANYLI